MSERRRNRDKRINVWVYDEEYTYLKKKAVLSGITISEYIRNIIAYGGIRSETTNFTRDEATALMRELNSIGNNVNQIAYRANARASVDSEDVDELREEFRNLLGLFHNSIENR